MSLTELNRSDITPHLRYFLDDLISIASGTVIKQTNIAAAYEDPTSATLFEYYKAIISGTDTLEIYDKIPYEAYSTILSWNQVGEEANDSFPDYIEYGKSEIPMKNKINICYIGNAVPDVEFGNKYDGFIVIKQSSMDELTFLRESIYGFDLITDMSTIDFDNDYCMYNDEIVPISSVDHRYIKENDNYTLSEVGTYVYNIEYNRYLKSETFDSYQIEAIIQSKIQPYEYKDEILAAMRNYVINTYVNPDLSPDEDFAVKRYFGENNTYYRLLNGLPAADKMSLQPRVDRLSINPNYRGDDKNPYLYNLTDEEIDIIKKNGTYDRLVRDHPSANYLRYMGTNRIDVLEARSADNFDILRIGEYSDKMHYDIFISNFQIAKEYVMRKYYHPELFSRYEYYGNYISYQILFQAMCQCVARSDSILLNYLYSDEDTVRLRLESYGLNVFDEIPLIYRKNIAKYIEVLIRNKGTDGIYPIIVSLFGADNIEIYKYFYRRIRDKDGNIQLSMAQVPVGTTNFINDMIKDINKINYDEVTGADVYWGSYGMPIGIDPDEYLKDIITNKTSFNYANSKYISINSIYNLSKLNFNSSYLMNYLLELSHRNQNLTIPVDTIDDNESLFMTLVFLFAVQAKRLKYDGNIQHDAVSVAYVMKYNLDDYIIKDNKQVKIIDLYKQYYRDYYYKYIMENNLTEDDANRLVSLTIPSDISLQSISDSYLTNSGLDGAYSKLITLRDNAETYKEYECYDQLLKAISVSKMNNNIFKLSEPLWIEIDNFVTWIKVDDETLKQTIINDYNNGVDTDYILCTSHGSPDLSLGYEYSDEYTQYCIDVSNNDVYIKEKVVSGTMDNNRYIGYNNILYVGTDDVSAIEINAQYDNPYYYNKETDKLYKYLKYARTYQEYLQYENIVLYDLLQPNADEYERDSTGNILVDSNGNQILNETYYDRLDELYVSLIVDIENSIKNDELKTIFSNSSADSGLLSIYIKRVINVFKSFEVDIAAINIIYEMDDRSMYRIKLIDEFSTHTDDYHYDHIHFIESMAVDEKSTVESSITIRDELNIEEN